VHTRPQRSNAVTVESVVVVYLPWAELCQYPFCSCDLRLGIHREFNGKDPVVYYLLPLLVINARRGIAVDLEVSNSIVLTRQFGIAKVSTIRGGFVNVARHCRDCVGSLWSCQGRTALGMWRASLPVEAQNSSLLNREKGPLFHKPHGRRLHVEDTSRVHRWPPSLSLGKPYCGVRCWRQTNPIVGFWKSLHLVGSKIFPFW
jgi:hypothetical protein